MVRTHLSNLGPVSSSAPLLSPHPHDLRQITWPPWTTVCGASLVLLCWGGVEINNQRGPLGLMNRVATQGEGQSYSLTFALQPRNVAKYPLGLQIPLFTQTFEMTGPWSPPRKAQQKPWLGKHFPPTPGIYFVGCLPLCLGPSPQH